MRFSTSNLGGIDFVQNYALAIWEIKFKNFKKNNTMETMHSLRSLTCNQKVIVTEHPQVH
jgi:hypothetical protein